MGTIKTKIDPDEKLTKEQIAGLKLPEKEDIDYSDIPKMTEEELKQFRRVSKPVTKKITINLNEKVIVYFKEQADITGIPYQTLINLYLTDCAEKKKKPEMTWV